MGVFRGLAEYDLHGVPKWRFSWEVSTGPHQGETASALCDRKIKKETLPGKLIAGLGVELVVGDDVEDKIKSCEGKPYLVMVSPGPNGGKIGVQSCQPTPSM
jgi:hypothetical protein